VCTTVLTTSTILPPQKKKNIYVFRYTVLSALQVWWWNDAAAAALGAPRTSVNKVLPQVHTNVTVTQQQQHHLPSASRGLKPATTPFYLPFQSIHGVMVVSKKKHHANPCNLHCFLRAARGFSARPGPAPLNPTTRASLLFNGIFVLVYGAATSAHTMSP
jgi:hypothetical protein